MDLATELTTQGTTDLTMALTILFECTKHIEVDCHDIRKAFDDKIIITLPHVTTDPKLPTFSLNLFREQNISFSVDKLMFATSPTSI